MQPHSCWLETSPGHFEIPFKCDGCFPQKKGGLKIHGVRHHEHMASKPFSREWSCGDTINSFAVQSTIVSLYCWV